MGLAEIGFVKKSRTPGTCDYCGKEIPKGVPYKWMSRYRQPALCRCDGCPTWKESERESNQNRAAVYAAVENATDAIDKWTADEGKDALAGILDTFADAIRDAAEGYRETASNIEDGLGHPTEKSEEMNGWADDLDSWADDMDGALDDQPDEPEDCETCNGTGKDDAGADCPDCEGTGKATDDWTEALKDAATEKISDCPLD